MQNEDSANLENNSAADDKKMYAGFWIRLAAYLIDYVILDLLLVLLSLVGSAAWWYLHPLGRSGSPMDGAEVWLFILYLPLFWLYRTVLESSRMQGTLGKLACGLAVTDSGLRRIGFGRANARFWSRVLSCFLFVGFIVAAFTEKKRALHDVIAGTVVVKKTKIPAANISLQLTP